MDEGKRTRLRKLAKLFLVKIPLALCVLGGVFILSLKLVEGYPDPLRQGFEDYLSKAYHTSATIEHLDKATFFPVLDIQISDITMHSLSNAAKIDMGMKSVILQAPFWSMFYNTGQLYALKIDKLETQAGFLLAHAINLENIEIIDREGPEQYGAFLVSSGTYNDLPLNFEAKLKKLNKGYKIDQTIPFYLKIGPMELNAQTGISGGKTMMDNATLTYNSKISVAKDYILFEDQQFTQDNPLYCMIHATDIKECSAYITE